MIRRTKGLKMLVVSNDLFPERSEVLFQPGGFILVKASMNIIVGLLDCWIIGIVGLRLLDWIGLIGLLDCWIAGLLDCWIVGLLDCLWIAWIAGLLSNCITFQ